MTSSPTLILLFAARFSATANYASAGSGFVPKLSAYTTAALLNRKRTRPATVNLTGTNSNGVLVTTPITVVVTAAPVPTAGVLDHFAPTFDAPVAQ